MRAAESYEEINGDFGRRELQAPASEQAGERKYEDQPAVATFPLFRAGSVRRTRREEKDFLSHVRPYVEGPTRRRAVRAPRGTRGGRLW